MTKNILVTAIGSFSAECVVKSLKEELHYQVIGCDIYPAEWHSVSKEFVKVLKAPLVKDKKDYFEFIKEICEKYSIDIIIPLTDVEVDFYNEFRQYFLHKNIIVTIGSAEFLSVARNKKNLTDFFKESLIVKTIKTYSIQDLKYCSDFPLIAKPIDGRSSEGIYIINSIFDIKDDLCIKNYIFQEIIIGPICTVDYVRSANSGKDFCLPRQELLRTKNGAGMTIQTFKSPKLYEIVNHIGDRLNVNGCINIEFIVKDHEYYLVDINPRFSAGIAFSKLAGYDFVHSHINCFINKEILPGIDFLNFVAEKKMVEVVNKFL